MFNLRFLKRLRTSCMRLREIVKQKHFPDLDLFLPPTQSLTDLEAHHSPQNFVYIPLIHPAPSTQILVIFYDKG